MLTKKSVNKRALAAACLIISVTFSAYAANLERVDIIPNTIDVKDRFRIQAGLSGDTCGTELKFYIDDRLASSRTVGCSRDLVESKEIDTEGEGIGCGKHAIHVDLIQNGEVSGNLTKEISVGKKPVITVEEKPQPGTDFYIHFEDSETGNPVKNLVADIYSLRKTRGSANEYSTNSKGDLRFSSSDAGEYQIIIKDSEYCGNTSFYVKRQFNIDGPHPEAPLVGELSEIAAPSGVTLKVYNETGNLYYSSATSVDGGVNLTIDDAGNYTLVFGESSPLYWGRNLSLYVADKLQPEVKLTPGEKLVTGQEISVLVSANKTVLAGKKVVLLRPTGDPKEFTTDDAGGFNYTPITIGQYFLKIEDARYKPYEKSFEVRDMLYADYTPKEPKLGDDINVYVRDSANNLVSGATVSIKDASYGLTGADGKYAFKPPQPGTYSIEVTKQGCWDAEKKEVNVMSPLIIKVDPDGVEVGGTVKIKVYDAMGNEVSADVEVILPDGEMVRVGDSYVTVEAGAHNVTARSAGYVESSMQFTADPHPLNLAAGLVEDRLIINASSNDQPAAGIVLSVKKPTGREECVTNDKGRAEVQIKKEGLIKITANPENRNPSYIAAAISYRIEKKKEDSNFPNVISAIVLIAALAAAAVYVIPKIRGLPGDRKKRGGAQPYFRQSGRSSISGPGR